MVRTPPPQIGPDFNPGKARWCEAHNRLECTKNKHGHVPCHGIAMRGVNACKRHAGMSIELAKVQGEAIITAWSAIGRAQQEISPSMAVLGMLQLSWLRAKAYGELLRRQVVVDGEQSGSVDTGDGEGEENASGLIGFQYGMGGRDGITYRKGEEIRGLVTLEASERDRVVKYAKTAHDMGISDRLINLAERWGDVVASRVTIILDELHLTPEQAALVPDLLTAHLGAIDLGSMSGVEDLKLPQELTSR